MSAKSASLAAKAAASSLSVSAAESASQAASAASKSGTSLTSQAGSAASKASASLSSGAAKASSAAGNLADEIPTKSAGIFSLSTLTLTILAIALAGAYYNGYLDGLIAYVQQLLGQAEDEKKRVLKENTGHTSVRSAARDAMNQGTARTEEMSDALHAKAQRQETGRVQNVKLDGPASLISDSTKI